MPVVARKVSDGKKRAIIVKEVLKEGEEKKKKENDPLSRHVFFLLLPAFLTLCRTISKRKSYFAFPGKATTLEISNACPNPSTTSSTLRNDCGKRCAKKKSEKKARSSFENSEEEKRGETF